jgi:UPF0042 nucleotide-binding protein
MESASNTIQLYIISGLSGAGKSQAIHYFEDSGFFCIDNLPPALLQKFAQLCLESQGKISKVALTIDVRGGEFFDSLFDALAAIDEMGIRYRILFLEASDEVLVRRFSETRRKHPLSSGGRISEDIQYERKSLSELREVADFILNTSEMTSKELYEEIRRVIEYEASTRRMQVIVVSFGFKYGVPLDCDLIFDVRFLPNPFYINELKAFSGLDQKVYDYVLGSEAGTAFAGKLKGFVDFLIPQFFQEPKSRLQIGIGCTGGRHRSVAFTEFLFKELKSDLIVVSRRHRDLELK